MAHPLCRAPVAAAFTCLLTALAGCQSPATPQAAPRPVSRNLAAVQEQSKVVRRELLKLQSSLKTLGEAPPEDLLRAFSAYESAINALGSDVGGASWLGGMSQPHNAEYFKLLDKEIKQVTAEDLRIRPAEQHDALAAEYLELQNKLVTLRASFTPFMNNVLDIRKAISLNLTPAGRAAQSSTISQTLTQSDTVLADMDALMADLAKLRGN